MFIICIEINLLGNANMEYQHLKLAIVDTALCCAIVANGHIATYMTGKLSRVITERVHKTETTNFEKLINDINLNLSADT